MTEPTRTTLPNGDIVTRYPDGQENISHRGRTYSDVMDELRAHVGYKAAALIEELAERIAGNSVRSDREVRQANTWGMG